MSSSLVVRYQEQRQYAEVPAFRRETEGSDTLQISFDDVQALLKHSQNLQQATKTLLEAPTDTGIGEQAIQSELTAIHAALEHIAPLLQSLWQHISITNRPNTRSAKKATEVFLIPELLEQILSHLDPIDLLRALKVNRTFCDTVDTSPLLNRTLGLIPDNKSSFYSPLLNSIDFSNNKFPGLTAYTRQTWHARDHTAADNLRTVTN